MPLEGLRRHSGVGREWLPELTNGTVDTEEARWLIGAEYHVCRMNSATVGLRLGGFSVRVSGAALVAFYRGFEIALIRRGERPKIFLDLRHNPSVSFQSGESKPQFQISPSLTFVHNAEMDVGTVDDVGDPVAGAEGSIQVEFGKIKRPAYLGQSLLLRNCVAKAYRHAHPMPEISMIRVDGDSFYATVEGEEIQITTFRETLWRQHKVYLPPPFTETCTPQTIYCDIADALSDPMQIAGCIHDPWVAAKMADFARDRLSNGVYAKPILGELDSQCRGFLDLHRALADPNLADRLLRIQQCRTLEEFQRYWKTLYYLFHALIGWDRVGDGLAWWYSSGRNAHGDPRLELVNTIWDDDGQLDYFAAHCWREGFACSHPDELSPAAVALTSRWRDEDWWRQFKRQGRRFGQDPFYGGSNPLHLDSGCCLRGTSGVPALAQCADKATRSATLVVGEFSSWRSALEEFGKTLPSDSQRSWHVHVFDRCVGHLGLFRRSRVTGRWFQGKHSVHMRGHGQEVDGIAD